MQTAAFLESTNVGSGWLNQEAIKELTIDEVEALSDDCIFSGMPVSR